MRVTPEGGPPKKGGSSQVPRSPPLKHTTAYTVKNPLSPACSKILAQNGANKSSHNSPADSDRALFKPSKDAERLVLSIKKIGKFGF